MEINTQFCPFTRQEISPEIHSTITIHNIEKIILKQRNQKINLLWHWGSQNSLRILYWALSTLLANNAPPNSLLYVDFSIFNLTALQSPQLVYHSVCTME